MTYQTVPLSSLKAPANNPRCSFDPETLAGLAESIHNDGLLQNLVVRKDRGKQYRVLAGHRRLKALKLLSERGSIAADYPVPVDIRSKPDKQEILRLSTVENVQRENLPPIDEAEAFAAMIRAGTATEDVAAETGLSVVTVKRRLALAGLCEEAKQAVRDGTLSLAFAEALTLGSHDQQRAMLEDVVHGYFGSAESIRFRLTQSRPTVAMARFPLENYTGTLTADLFDDPDTTYFDDIEQFHTLQQEAVKTLVAEHEAQAAWVDLHADYGWERWKYQQAAEGEVAGVVIYYAPSGEVEIITGLTRRQTEPQQEAGTMPDTEAKPKPEYTKGAIRTIAAHKTLAVQASLLANPRKAKELAAARLLTRHQWHIRPHDALWSFEGEEAPRALQEIEAEGQRLAALLNAESDPDNETGWRNLFYHYDDSREAYRAVQSLNDADLEALLTWFTVLSFGQERDDELDTGGTIFSMTGTDLDITMRDWWQPDPRFLSTRRKEQLLAVAGDSGAGKGRMRALEKSRKSDLVQMLADYFTECSQPKEQPTPRDEQGRQWCPDAMRFDLTGHETEDAL